MSRKGLLSRRMVLRGAGGLAFALPLLDEVPGIPRRTAAAAGPKRFVVFFGADGTVRDKWLPTGSETAFSLSPILAPLEPFKQRLVVLDGITTMGKGGKDNHQAGMGGMLTGTELNSGPFGGGSGWANGISVDQEIAKHIGTVTKFRSLELSAYVLFNLDNNTRMSYLGPNQPIAPENSPYAAFDRVFSRVSTSQPMIDADRARSQSVIDATLADLKYVLPRLGSSDRVKVQAHVDAVRDIESRLGIAVSAGCQKPSAGALIDWKKMENFPAVCRLQMDLAAAALACDLTRVASFLFSRSVDAVRYSWLGIPEIDHHELSHAEDSNAVAQEKLVRINKWTTEQLAYFLGRLQAIPEGGGTVLDNTLVYFCNPMGKGKNHLLQNTPLVIVGNGGGHFKTGRFVRSPANTPHNNVLVSLLNAMGVGAQTFGRPDWCTGPLQGL